MEPFRHHVYVCAQKKPEGAPACLGRGAEETHAALVDELAAAGLTGEVQVTTCGCLGICGKGPNLVVYPEGVWYAGVGADESREIVREHLAKGAVVERLVLKDAAKTKDEILAHDRMVAGMKKMMDQAGILPEELNLFMRGFMESRLVLTAVELDVCTAIGAGATFDEVAKKTGTDPRATEMLLNALASIKLLEKEDGVFTNGKLAARYLDTANPDNLRDAAMHPAGLWHRWSTLTECLKIGTSVARQKGEERDEDGTRAFIAAMNRNASAMAGLVAGTLDLGPVNRLLDVGAGSGAYSIAFAQKKPGLDVTAFDLPPVIALTKGYVKDAGLDGQVKFIEGDMTADPFGDGYDLIYLGAICHMWGPDENLALFKKAHAALNPGGRLVVQDFILKDDKTSPRFGAVFALNMLVNTKAGSSYSKEEYVKWLKNAGFANTEFMPLPGPADMVIGVKP